VVSTTHSCVIVFVNVIVAVVIVRSDVDILNRGPDASLVVLYLYYMTWDRMCTHGVYYSDLASSNLINPFSEAHDKSDGISTNLISMSSGITQPYIIGFVYNIYSEQINSFQRS